MKKIKYFILIFIVNLITFSYVNITNAAIDLAISPIKYELEADPWTTITKTAKIRNPSKKTVHIITWKSDFVPNWNNWLPRFIRKSEMVFPDQQLSEWISISTWSFDLAPWETKVINFNVNIPDNATPGWHYWAVFFKSNNSEKSSWANVWINVDYWILVLLKVKWDIIINAEIEEPIIYTSWSNSSWNQLQKDNCPNWDNSASYYDWTCKWKTENNNNNTNTSSWNNVNDNLANTWTWNNNDTNNNTWNSNNTWALNNINQNTSTWNIDNNDFSNNNSWTLDNNNTNINTSTWSNNNNDLTNTLTWSNNDKINNEASTDNWNNDNNDDWKENNIKKEEKDFNVWFIIPIKNKWNTHIKPKWKIVLKDENWNIIKKVWKEIVTNEKWAIIWERIVDYIPINDAGGVVIPGSSRKFECNWKWFPYRDYNKEWNPIIKYWNPNEYYTRQNLWESRVLMPWEKIEERKVNKIITADFNLKYKWLDGKDIEYNSAKEFPVEYTEKYVAINYYVLYPIFATIFLIILFILIALSKRTKCIKCKKSIKKDMKVCPYCWAKQKKKK